MPALWINLNEYVRFKPNERTGAWLREYAERFASRFPSMGSADKAELLRLMRPTLELDSEGYAKWQIHKFMQVFGESLYVWNDPVIDLDVQFISSKE